MIDHLTNGLATKPANRITSELLDRQPPRNLEAEKGLLGSILLKPEVLADVSPIVGPDDFYDEANRTLFAHMRAIGHDGTAVDATLLVNRLRSCGDDETTGGTGYLAQLTQSVPHAANAAHYANIVREQSQRRKLIHLGSELLQGVYRGDAADNLIDRAMQEVDAIRRAGGSPAQSPLRFDTLLNDNPRLAEIVVEGILRRGETGNVIAAPKVGKSWLGYSLALSVNTGGDWLGRFACRRGRVLLIDNELHRETLAHRIPAAADALSIRHDEYAAQLDVLALRGRLIDLNGIARLLEAVEPGTYELVILDALYRALPEGVSENDNAAMAMLFNTIDRITARLNCAWLNVHHASKGEQGGKAVTDVGSGAGAQSRAADAHIILRQHEQEGAVVLEAVVRSFAPVEPLPLRWTFPIWTPDEGLDPAAVRGRLTRQQERQTDADREGIDRLREALRSGAATVRDLRGTTGYSKPRTERLLDLMESRREITWTEIKKRGNPCREYRLSEAKADGDV